MNPHALLAQRKLVLTLVALLSLIGLVAWGTMTRQEDPRLREYFGQVVVTFPGADAATVERLVLEPLEDELARVDELDEVESTAEAEIAVAQLTLREGVDDIDRGWDRVRQAVARAWREMPADVPEPSVDDRLQDQESVVYALTGSVDPLALAAAAETLEHHLLAVPGVSQVRVVADPEEQITIELDDAAARRLGLTSGEVAAQLAPRTRILPGGSLQLGDRAVRLRPRTDFSSLEEIRTTPLLLPSGEAVPLDAVARVRRGPREPARTRMRHDGRPAVGLGVVPRAGINVVDFGERVRVATAELAPSLAPVEVHEVIFQPRRVASRLADLSRSLLTGALVVAGVLILAMGLRMGLVVASVVPLVTLSALALYAVGGGVLHQMSIAAVVLALGMLVDNAIVVAESIQWRLDDGEAPMAAAAGAVRELAVPLAGATATTFAAFLPMLLAPGMTAEFTRAIPVMVMLTLGVSWLFALLVTPALGERFLKPRHTPGDGERRAVGPVTRGVSRLAVGHPGWVAVGALLLVGLSLAAFSAVRQDFFPSSDRNQLVVDVKLPEGSHLDATDAAARRLERLLTDDPQVTGVAAFLGRSTPHFYYNLPQIPWSAHLAQLVVVTTGSDALDPVADRLRGLARREVPQAQVVVRKLEQGPPVTAPVEVRLYGEDLAALATGADRLVDTLRRIRGTADVRHDLSTGSPVLEMTIDDAAAARRGLSRADVARALFTTTRGAPVGVYRADDDPVPVVLRSPAGEDTPTADLDSLAVTAPGNEPVPLAQVARLEARWRPAAIQHRDHRRVVRVFSQLAPGATYGDVVEQLAPRLAELELPEGVVAEMGGAAETSSEANNAMLGTLPAGILLLLGVLMAEFRSFRRVGLVLVTVPLAAAGVVPGLLLGDQPFGFMSLLGVMALAGVVVNNAIVLLEVIESRRREGAAVAQAVRDGIERRLRPILLTAVTTIVGLLPLAFSSSTLWPPLAWAMISGLAASTLLTLLVVPALYLLLFDPPAWLGGRGRQAPPGPRMTEATASEAASKAALLALCLLPALLAVSLRAPAALGQDAPPPAESPAPPAESLETSVDRFVDGLPPDIPEAAAGAEAAARQLAGVPARPVTLVEVLALAEDRPRVAAARSRAVAADHRARSAKRTGWWPSVSGEATIFERGDVRSLDTPVGQFDLGESRAETAAAVLTQPLVDAAQQRYATPATRLAADAAILLATRQAQLAAAEAGEAYLDVLALDARSAATQAFVDSLQASLDETQARVREGRALEADALKVRLALDQAEQDLRSLANLRFVALRQLGRSAGVDLPLEPAPRFSEEHPPLPPPPPFPQAFGEAMRQRPEVRAARQRIEATVLRRRAIHAEAWPRLEAQARWTWADGSGFGDGSVVEGGLRLAWNPFAAGTRAEDAAALEAEQQALLAEWTELRRQVELELRAALARLDTALGALEVGRIGVRQATETLRVERERHSAGRVTTNDLLEAEAALRDRRTVRDVAELEVLRAWIRLGLAVGDVGQGVADGP